MVVGQVKTGQCGVMDKSVDQRLQATSLQPCAGQVLVSWGRGWRRGRKREGKSGGGGGGENWGRARHLQYVMVWSYLTSLQLKHLEG